MGSGIGASLTTFSSGTTIQSSQVNSNFSALNNGGVSNDSGNITTDGTGVITCKSITTTKQGAMQGVFLCTPYQLANNTTINNGNTTNYACTGGATGVPTGAKAVFMNMFFTPSAAGTFASITPQGTGWGNGNYPVVGTAFNGTNICAGSFLAVLNSSNGQIAVTANGGNLAGVYLWLYAYVY